MARRGPSEPYRLPHRREGSTAVPQPADLSLESLSLGGGSIQVQVVVTEAGDWSACPFSVLPAATGTPEQRVLTLPDTNEFASDLLSWFRDATAGRQPPESDRCKIVLPAELSKERRKAWHGLSKKHQLQSVSQGIGDERHLQIALPKSAAVGPEPKHVSPEAKRLWALAQEEGGRCWQLSLNEIQNMMDHNSPQLVELLKLDTKRAKARQLEAVILSGDCTAAVQMIEEDPGLVWARAAPSGDYPLINALRRGRLEVVQRIVRKAGGPGVPQQKSRRYQSALELISQHTDASLQDELRAALIPP